MDQNAANDSVTSALPALVVVLLLVDVRLLVQVLAAHRAEAGAVGPAEDLVGQRENDGVASRILLDLDVELERIRNEVIRMSGGHRGQPG